jgi:hypothetical protein
MCGRVTRRANAFATDRLAHGHRENAHVEPERAMINVPDVAFELLFPAQSVAPVDLRPARDSRSDFMTTRLLWRVPIKVLSQQRARANETHVTAKDIPQFWEFVETQTTEQCTNSSESRSVTELTVYFLVHRPELDDLEGIRVSSWSHLPKKNRLSHR